MSRKSKRIIAAVLASWLLAVTCNLPAGTAQPVTFSDEDVANTAVARVLTAQPTIAPSATEAPSATPNPTATQCQPAVTANTNANVRTGPGTVYDIIGYLPTGGTAPLAGRNDDGTWWYITFPGGIGGYAWIAGSVATASCVPQVVQVVAAPPTPTSPPPTKTEKVAIPPLLFVTLHAPLLPLQPIGGDIQIVEIFLSTHKEVVVRVAVNPTNSLSGSVTYKVWVDGALKATKTESLPAGSAAYWSGVIIPSGNHTVRVKIDTANQYAESDEGNNDVTVTCNGSDLSCH